MKNKNLKSQHVFTFFRKYIFSPNLKHSVCLFYFYLPITRKWRCCCCPFRQCRRSFFFGQDFILVRLGPIWL